MSASVPHVSRLVPPGPTVRPPTADAPDDAGSGAARGVTLERTVAGDPRALGALLADVEPLRADGTATIVTDADAETVRFLAVLAVLEGRAPMPDYDLDDPSLKWHAAKGVKAVPNPPSIVTGPASQGGGAA
jgi:hypothetical protein